MSLQKQLGQFVRLDEVDFARLELKPQTIFRSVTHEVHDRKVALQELVLECLSGGWREAAEMKRGVAGSHAPVDSLDFRPKVKRR